LVCAVLLIVVGLHALIFVGAEMWNIQRAFSLNYAEGHVLWMAMQMGDRHLAYQRVDRPPYVAYPYTPLYMLTVRLLSRGSLLMTGRWLSTGSALALAWILAWTIFECLPGHCPVAWKLASAGFGAIVPLTVDNVIFCASLMRVDVLALLLSFAGLAVFITKGRKPVGQFVAVALFVLAVFTKQTALPAPAACLIAGLLASRRWTIRAYSFGGLLGIAGLAGFTGVFGKLFLWHIFIYAGGPYSLGRGLFAIFEHLRANMPMAVLAAAVALQLASRATAARVGWVRFCQHRLSSDRYDRATIIGCLYWVLATLWLLTIGNDGADVNYFLDWDTGCGFLAGLFLFRLLATWKVRSAPSAGSVTPSLLVAGVLLFSLGNATIAFPGPHARADRALEDAQAARIVQLIRETPGPVFSDDPLLCLMGEKPLVIEPATVNFMRRLGRWDERPFVMMLEQRVFGLIIAGDIANRQRFSPAQIKAIETAYMPAERIGEYSIYRPRQASPSIPSGSIESSRVATRP
jgi:hypothetical protein